MKKLLPILSLFLVFNACNDIQSPKYDESSYIIDNEKAYPLEDYTINNLNWNNAINSDRFNEHIEKYGFYEIPKKEQYKIGIIENNISSKANVENNRSSKSFPILCSDSSDDLDQDFVEIISGGAFVGQSRFQKSCAPDPNGDPTVNNFYLVIARSNQYINFIENDWMKQNFNNKIFQQTIAYNPTFGIASTKGIPCNQKSDSDVGFGNSLTRAFLIPQGSNAFAIDLISEHWAQNNEWSYYAIGRTGNYFYRVNFPGPCYLSDFED